MNNAQDLIVVNSRYLALVLVVRLCSGLEGEREIEIERERGRCRGHRRPDNWAVVQKMNTKLSAASGRAARRARGEHGTKASERFQSRTRSYERDRESKGWTNCDSSH
jgi:hypothetical protein